MKITTILLALLLSVTTCLSKELLRTDVLVIGGTTSGTTAGIAAARAGVKTLIVEQTPMLGGMLTAQGVSAIDGNADLPAGLWNEFRTAIRQHYGGIGAVWTGWVSTTLFEPHVADSIFKAMAAAEPLLEIRYGYRLNKVTMQGSRVQGAEFVNRQGDKLHVVAQIVIDATDLGETLPLTGTAYRVGMDAQSDTGESLAPKVANKIVQDLTQVAILKDYGIGADRTIPRPAGYDPAEFAGCCDHSEGTLTPERMLEYGKMPNGKYMLNWPKSGNDIYLNAVDVPYKKRLKILKAAHAKTLRFVYYIQHDLGFKHLGIADDEFDTPDGLAYLPYHREGRRLDGIIRFTLDDVTNRYDRPTALYRTGISVGDYPVDHHHGCYPDIGKIDFPPVPSFSVPLGALIPAKTENLIVSDKAISVSNLINGSTRLQPVVMLTGQAAGILAATAVRQECAPRQVSVREVQRALLAEKAYIVPLYDVKPDDPDFEILQRIAATGILRMTGEPFHWASRSWFYPERPITTAEFTHGLKDYAPQIEIINRNDNLNIGTAISLLQKAGASASMPQGISATEPITRRQLAKLIDSLLDPFSKEIGFDGCLK